MTLALQPKRARSTFRKLYRLDVRCGGGPFIPESFHETFEEAFDRGLLLLGIEEGDPVPPGSDFRVRESGGGGD